MAAAPPEMRPAPAGPLRATALLLGWNLVSMRAVLPLVLLVQTGLAAGVVVGFAFLYPAVDPDSARYLATGAVTIALTTVGLVLVPQMLATAKTDGSYDWSRTLPAPRLAALAADLLTWLLVALPGVVLALVVATWRFDLTPQVSALFPAAVLLVTLAFTAAGYALAVWLRPRVAMSISQLLLFGTLMFSPITYPPERLPDWLRAAHEWLPFTSAAELIRGTLTVEAVSPRAWVLVAVWAAAGVAAVGVLASRRG
ncbi:MAG TPA: ABC transporter permease [Pseudonocardia sp.]|nr:ABC transporter permease [Pseudonocardia sp.]